MALKYNFAVFILTNGRPDDLVTIDTLKTHGYTGPIYLIVDNLDKTREQYIKKYGDIVKIFDKKAVGETFDRCDNFSEYRTITYARNASYDVAEQLGIDYFVQFDDDYCQFQWRFDSQLKYITRECRRLDNIFNLMIDYYKTIPVATIAMAQGGDFMGGSLSALANKPRTKRKAMNSFLCSPKRRVNFISTMNEDVCTYTSLGSRGVIFLTINMVSLVQGVTQKNDGGISGMYRDFGTYVKSFYTVMNCPASVKIRLMGRVSKRLHHSIAWKHTVPMILRESVKKTLKTGENTANG